MPMLTYLAARKDLEARGYLITGAVQAHPMTAVVIEYMDARSDPRHSFKWRAIVYALDAGQLSRRLCFAHVPKESKCQTDERSKGNSTRCVTS